MVSDNLFFCFENAQCIGNTTYIKMGAICLTLVNFTYIHNVDCHISCIYSAFQGRSQNNNTVPVVSV